MKVKMCLSKYITLNLLITNISRECMYQTKFENNYTKLYRKLYFCKTTFSMCN